MTSESGPNETVILSLEALKAQDISKEEFWEGTFDQYLEIALRQPEVAYSAYQRMYRAIVRHGVRRYTFAKQDFIRYNFFDDPFSGGQDAVYGIDNSLMRLVEIIKAGASRLGQERRILLLHGPVGSAKSTIARLLRKGLQADSRTEEGKLYTFSWIVEENDEQGKEILGLKGANRLEAPCPIHEDPFMLLPSEARKEVEKALNKVPAKDPITKEVRPRRIEEIIRFEGELCPFCRNVYREFLKREQGNWRKVIRKHVKVQRLIFSEVDRIGLGSFRPKDEKNQDSTELSGDINYRKIAEIGKESDPRAFNFDGEFQVSHRGFFYIEEIFKLDKAFLYDLLGATQEHVIKPKRFAEMYIDEVIMGGTNNPEYEKLRDDETMEAFRDRTTRVDIPYILKVSEEVKVYNKIYGSMPPGRHIAPHTIEMASLWSVLSRVEDPKKISMGRRDKVRLYDGKSVPGFTEDHIKELMREHENEGMGGISISPRYIQDKIANAFIAEIDVPCVTPFAVFHELKEGLRFHSLIKEQSKRDQLLKLMSDVEEEYKDIIKSEVQQAIAADEESLKKLFNNYIENVVAFIEGTKVRNEFTGEDEEPNERLMRDIEEKIGVSEQEKKDFRAKIVQSMGTRARRGQKFDYRSDEQLLKALQLKLFEDQKDTIKLSTLHTRVVDPEEQEKIEVVKKRMKERFGYCDYCATIVLNQVATIFVGGAQIEQNK